MKERERESKNELLDVGTERRIDCRWHLEISIAARERGREDQLVEEAEHSSMSSKSRNGSSEACIAPLLKLHGFYSQ